MYELQLELFKVVLQDYLEDFKRSSTAESDQCFFLCGQMLGFHHRLPRRILSRESWPVKNEWDALLRFEFIDSQLLAISQVMEKTEFRTKAMKSAKVEKEKIKNSKTEVIASAVMGDMLNPYVNHGRAYIRYACTELLKHPTFKSD